jgi:hypothetical protein
VKGRSLLGPLLLAALSGCTVTATSADLATPGINSCQSDSDCGGSGTCVNRVCQANDGRLDSLLIEVTPASDSEFPHIPFIAHLEGVPTGSGSKDISLESAAHVKGEVRLADDIDCMPSFYDETCPGKVCPTASDRSIPLAVQLVPRDGLLGLPSQNYLAKTEGQNRDGLYGVQSDGSYVFDLQVPAGDYDIYVAPPKIQTGCHIPPQLFRREGNIKGGDVKLQYTITAGHELTLHLRWPLGGSTLNHWKADIIEPLGGNVISTEVELLDPPGTAEAAMACVANVPCEVQYSVPLVYSSVTDRQSTSDSAVDAASELVRLTPPADVVAPTIYMDRAGLELFPTDGEVAVDGFRKFPTAVEVEGQVASQSDGAPAGGQVTLVSSEVFGIDSGIFASFQKTVDVADDGRFSLLMPPGKYRVYAVPPMAGACGSCADCCLSATETSWEISADIAFQAGKLIELPAITEVTGQASLQGSQVQAVASPQLILPFEQAFGAAAFVPRANPGLVEEQGNFKVYADPGRFDISVRPPDASGFGWYVRPAVTIGSGAQDLGRLVLLAPSVVSGTVAVTGLTSATTGEATSSVPVSSALIRAYAYLDKSLAYTPDATLATSVIQVAETRSTSSGAFRLLLPSSIAAPK